MQLANSRFECITFRPTTNETCSSSDTPHPFGGLSPPQVTNCTNKMFSKLVPVYLRSPFSSKTITRRLRTLYSRWESGWKHNVAPARPNTRTGAPAGSSLADGTAKSNLVLLDFLEYAACLLFFKMIFCFCLWYFVCIFVFVLFSFVFYCFLLFVLFLSLWCLFCLFCVVWFILFGPFGLFVAFGLVWFVTSYIVGCLFVVESAG